MAGACAAIVVSAALVASHAYADNLSDLRDQVKTNQDSQEKAKKEVDQSNHAVQSATNSLIDSQNRLSAAQAQLADVQVQLAAAKENDTRLAADLRQARMDLEEARQNVSRAQGEVDAQVKLIGSAARESYQQQSDLRDLSILFGSETPAELSQRLQWNTTIFDSQAAVKARLDAVRDELEVARKAQADAEARVASDREESARVVTHVASLEQQAQQLHTTVSGLVAENKQAQAAAQGELNADESAYRGLVSDEQKLQDEIRGELGRIRAEEQARAREAAAREAAARAAAAKANAPKPRPGTPAKPAPKPGPGSPGAPKKATSSSGFIRPVAANPGSPFGLRFHPILKYWRMHNGTDFGARTGTPIYAAKSGKVMKAGLNGGFGNFVLIGHGDDAQGRYVTTGYAHMSKVVARVGQWVEQGQLIGYVGSTGLSTTPHLHLEVRLDGRPVNPLIYIP